jgi:hypothetical protein
VVLAHYSTFAQHEALSLVVTGRADALEFYNQGTGRAGRVLRPAERGVSAATRRRHRQDVERSARRPLPDLREDAGPFSFESWLAAIRAGRTFMTSGPLISLSVDGHEIGDTVHIGPRGRDVVVEARVDSIFPVNSLQIVVGGAVAGEATSAVGATHLDWRGSVRVNADTWIAARSGGPGYATNALRHHVEPPPPGEKPIDFSKAIIAHTSPIYLAAGDRWNAFDARVVRYLLTAMEGGIAHLRNRAAVARDVSYAHEITRRTLSAPIKRQQQRSYGASRAPARIRRRQGDTT